MSNDVEWCATLLRGNQHKTRILSGARTLLMVPGGRDMVRFEAVHRRVPQ